MTIPMSEHKPANRNRTILLSDEETATYRSKLLYLTSPASLEQVLNRTICQDILQAAQWLPSGFVDLLFIDPPYNLDKQFNNSQFKKTSLSDYAVWMDQWLAQLIRLLKPTASIYICSDWRSSSAVYLVAEKYFKIRNRITWEREKGRGTLTNWKNCSEDIWFCTLSEEYVFNVDAVKLRRKVIAPYIDADGEPKDWQKSEDGNYRLTHPSNLWTDLTVPFWSMSENTEHPTQKPEKLMAKVILASSNPDDIVLDPFLGSGTTSVVAKKLHRKFVGVEREEYYCCLAEKRLAFAETDRAIQGYRDGVFWERNTSQDQQRIQTKRDKPSAAQTMQPTLFSED